MTVPLMAAFAFITTRDPFLIGMMMLLRSRQQSQIWGETKFMSPQCKHLILVLAFWIC
jgi:hypothetical protein